MADSLIASVKIIGIEFDYSKPNLSIETNWYFLAGLVGTILILYFIFKKLRKSRYPVIEMEVEISGSPKVKFKAQRDDSSIYIANRIYIELITRKAAIPLEDNKDVIIEMYDSWYKLFEILRDEIKSVPGHYLKSHDPTTALIGLTTKILNDGLRPHLTEYQAKFRKWYDKEIQETSSKDLTPQELQRRYPEYNLLIADIKRVNTILIDYSNELNKLIKGK